MLETDNNGSKVVTSEFKYKKNWELNKIIILVFLFISINNTVDSKSFEITQSQILERHLECKRVLTAKDTQQSRLNHKSPFPHTSPKGIFFSTKFRFFHSVKSVKDTYAVSIQLRFLHFWVQEGRGVLLFANYEQKSFSSVSTTVSNSKSFWVTSGGWQDNIEAALVVCPII